MNEKFKRQAFFLVNTFRSLAGRVLSRALVPQKCLCCGKDAVYEPLCPECKRNFTESFSLSREGKCSVCGRQLLSEQETCMDCRTSPVITHADFVFPLYPYRAWYKNLLFEWKMQNTRSLSAVFARALNRALCSIAQKNTCVLVPVPPRPGKIKSKGWDQVQETASFLSCFYGWNVLPLLERKSVEQQKKKNREQRLGSRETSYACSKKSLCLLEGWKAAHGGENPALAVVIDDVITTGVTVDSCSELVKGLGIAKVAVLSLFIVD